MEEKKPRTIEFPNNRLKELRRERKLSQDEMAEKLGITQRTYRYAEKGYALLPQTLVKLADLCGCSLDYLLGRSDCRTADNELVHQVTGLSDKAITQLKKRKNDPSVKVLDYLLTHVRKSQEDKADLLTLLSLYLNRKKDSNGGPVYYVGEDGYDIILGGEDQADGSLLYLITSRLAECRLNFLKRK